MGGQHAQMLAELLLSRKLQLHLLSVLVLGVTSYTHTQTDKHVADAAESNIFDNERLISNAHMQRSTNFL